MLPRRLTGRPFIVMFAAILAACGPRDSTPQSAEAAQLSATDSFLAQNKVKSGVITTDSGLQYLVRTSGPSSGPSPSSDSTVVISYNGKSFDGQTMRTIEEDGRSVEFRVGDLAPGISEALQRMRPGDDWTIWVPPEAGFGAEGAPPTVPPNSVLIFRIVLESVVGEADGRSSNALDAAEAPIIPVPSDPSAKYQMIDLVRMKNRNLEVTTRRDGTSGVSYARREVDCNRMRFRYLGDSSTLEGVRIGLVDPGPMGPLTERSISTYVSEFACKTARQSGL